MKRLKPCQPELVDEEKRGKRRYRMRVIQEQEAKEYVDDYFTDERNPNRVPPVGRKRSDHI